ncbi:MAG: hypothetical protein LKF31_08280 [Muribaculaceae bacterium]|jgi:hypothetical protein|nr:hypothetical protein [Muribaculaceae bacterium]
MADQNNKIDRLYVFGIGGTGSRVLKSLVMLLASGVDINATEIVPIIIDPDLANGDKGITVTAFDDYQKIYNAFSHGADAKQKCNFFSTPLGHITNEDSGWILNMDIKGEPFKDLIQLNSIQDPGMKALVKALFSQSNLDLKIDVGFKGNPNIGSVVLNQFDTTYQFGKFAGNFGQNDAIFIISSIFGGTGASGFPLLLKTLKQYAVGSDGTSKDNKTPNGGSGNIKNAPIGAITVMPYYDLEPPTNEDERKEFIVSSTFISKTKSALAYYADHVNGDLDALYYICDNDMKSVYPNQPGKDEQKNKAHFVELASALAIIDFANKHTKHEEGATKYYDFAIENNFPVIQFNYTEKKTDKTHKFLCDGTDKLLFKPLSMFTLFMKYLRDNRDVSQTWYKTLNVGNNIGTILNTTLSVFKLEFLNWLEELADTGSTKNAKMNRRAFSPFSLDESDKPFDAIKGVHGERHHFGNNDYARFNSTLNKYVGNKNNFSSIKFEDRFMQLFYQVIEKLLADEINTNIKQ